MAGVDDSDIEEDLISLVDDSNIFQRLSGRPLDGENSTYQTVDRSLAEASEACHSIANKRNQTQNDFTIQSDKESFFEELIKQDTEGDTSLHVAIINKQTSEALFIIQILGTCQLSIANEIGQTPLHLAALVGDFHVIKALVAKKVDLNQRDTKGRTVFHILCKYQHVTCLSNLVPELRELPEETNLVLALNAIDREGKSCLHYVCMQGDTQLVHILLGLDSNPNMKDRKTGRTALHFAAECGHLKIVQALIQHKGTNVNSEAYDEITPVALAYHRKKHNIVACLRKRGANYSRRHIEKFGPWRN